MSKITSLQNPKVKHVVRLRKRRERDQEGLFLIEGYRELSRALSFEIETLFISKEHFLGSNEPELIEKIIQKGAELFEVTPQVFEKLSYRDRPDGLIAIAKQKRLGLEEMTLSDSPLIVVCEAIEKPGNLGTILRSSDAAGADCVIVCDRCTDIYNPNVVRASVGTLFTKPIVETTTLDTIAFLKEKGISIVATTPHTDVIYTDSDLSGPIALVMGCEQLGLTETFLKAADIQVRIPMKGIADSLNVAAATTLVLFEAVRQKNARPLSR